MSTTRTERRSARGWLAAAVGALALAWLTTGHPLPVYDGINAPDEPYRYVAAPAGAKATKAPTPASASSSAIGGLNVDELRAQSGEVGPQVQVVVPKLALTGPRTATRLRLTVTPVAPDTQPTVGTIDGNVYRLQLSPGATFRAVDAPGAMRLRATSDSQPGPVFVHRAAASAPWATLDTRRVGNDIYEAGLDGVGDYALAFRPQDLPTAAGSSRSGGGVSPAVLVVIGLLVAAVVAGAVLATRRRAPAPP